jgi:hypothetical protein
MVDYQRADVTQTRRRCAAIMPAIISGDGGGAEIR